MIFGVVLIVMDDMEDHVRPHMILQTNHGVWEHPSFAVMDGVSKRLTMVRWSLECGKLFRSFANTQQKTQICDCKLSDMNIRRLFHTTGSQAASGFFGNLKDAAWRPIQVELGLFPCGITYLTTNNEN